MSRKLPSWYYYSILQMRTLRLSYLPNFIANKSWSWNWNPDIYITSVPMFLITVLYSLLIMLRCPVKFNFFWFLLLFRKRCALGTMNVSWKRKVRQVLLHSVNTTTAIVRLVTLLCLTVTLWIPGSSGQGIFQARILEWVAISSSRNYYRWFTAFVNLPLGSCHLTVFFIPPHPDIFLMLTSLFSC